MRSFALAVAGETIHPEESSAAKAVAADFLVTASITTDPRARP